MFKLALLIAKWGELTYTCCREEASIGREVASVGREVAWVGREVARVFGKRLERLIIGLG